LSEKMSQHMKEYIKRRPKPFKNFKLRMNDPSQMPEEEWLSWKVVGKYCRHHSGLDELLFFCTKWAKTSNVLENPINELHICLILLQFGLNHLPCEAVEAVPYWLEPITSPKAQSESSPINLEEQHGGLGKKFLAWLEYLASRQFETLELMDFREPGLRYESIFCERQWLPIHRAALVAFHQIAFTFRFDCLPATSDQRKEFLDTVLSRRVIEAEPFVIEIPNTKRAVILDNVDLMSQLCKRSGCIEIVFRPMPQFVGAEGLRLYVSAMGTMDSISDLRAILSVRPNLNLMNQPQEMSKQMADEVYQQLVAD